MNADEAERLLARARAAEWAFPTSFSGSNLAPGATWLDGLVADRAAMADAARWLTAAGRGEDGLELAARGWRVWLEAGDPAGGRAFLASVLDAGGGVASRWRALALYGDGMIAGRLGEWADAKVRNAEALAVAARARDDEARVFALLGTSRDWSQEGDDMAAMSVAGEALSIARTMPLPMQQAPLHMLAQSHRLAGDLDEAVALFRESLALNRSISDQHMVAVELHNLGHVELHLGNVHAADALFAEAAAMASDGDAYDAAMANLNRAAVAFARGDRDAAATLLSEARQALDEAGIPPARDDAAEMGWLDVHLRRQAS